MAVISILIFVAILIVIINANNNNDKNKDDIYENGNEKKIINIFKFILLCIPVFIAIYMVVGVVFMIIISSVVSYDSGAWAYGIILGFSVSAVLTPIVVYKLMKK